jgi:hypothetical protein
MVSHDLKQPGKQQRNYVQANACAKFTDWMIGVVALSLLQSIIMSHTFETLPLLFLKLEKMYDVSRVHP